MIAKSHPWQLSAVALAALLGLWGTQAQALSLGRISVQSSLGESLKAEIDILDINADESASLGTKVASPEAFKTAGLEFNPALSSLQATLQRRPDGRAYIKLSSDRVINDPFVDMILEVSWSTGRIVRDYTLLFDPPSLRNRNTAAPVSAQLPSPVAEPAPARVSPPPAAAPDLPAPIPAKPAAQAPKTPVAAVPKPVAQAAPASAQTVTVKVGDTAGKIAATYKPATVSLDQMLVALLRSNPNAFIGDNVNRVKAGAVLALPSEEQVSATSPDEAQKTIVAQSQDFNDFRRKFASNAPAAQLTPTSRNLSGKVQATVDDKKPAAATPDKLTLSKGALQAKSNEDQLAQARNVKEAANRSAELAKNISDLSKLAAASGASAPASTPASAPPTTLPAITAAPVVSAPASAAPSASAPATDASAPASAPPPVASAPKKPVSAVPPAPEPMPEPGFVDTLLENPLLPVGAAGLIALLAGFGVYKVRQRKKTLQLDSSFIESKARPDAFAGASGGQSVDTSDHLTTGSSMVYSPSQLDAVDDVDPVAEADVYLAYGRDLQAEEILKDALRNNPQRVAIHQKLLEIYAKRQDTKAFEAIATLAFNLTDGTGPDWEQICESGLSIDPDNALYLPGGQPYADKGPPTVPAAATAEEMAVDLDLDEPSAAPEPVAENAMDLDLDLDFSLDEPTADLPEPPVAAPDLNTLEFTTGPADMPEPASEPLPSISEDLIPDMQTTATEPAREPESFANSLDFSVSEPEPLPQDSAASENEPAASNSDLLSFDLDSLSLDLGDAPAADGAVDESQDPLETKLALAEEFKAIGDDDGARALIEEVIAEATGDMKVKAQQALNKL